jgi:aspartate carbamoyltransferase catalytic subunit
MHPLPRKGEISEAVDTDPRAKYLTEQMASGLSTRMALLAAMLLENPYEVLAQLEIWSDLR